MSDGALPSRAGAPPPAGYVRGDAGYRRITLALFAAGMTTFVGMYAAQAVLPQLAHELDVSPATSALAVSATTGALALAIVPASVLSERFGRTRVMAASALVSAVIGLALPWMPSMTLLVLLRALQGLALAGVPATAMAYLAEEVHAGSLGAAMGRYIAGTTIGGLAGRLVAGTTVDLTTWRWALEAAAVVSLVFTLVFVRLAPASRHFTPRAVGMRTTTANILSHLRTPALTVMFLSAFLLMGGFVSVYNVLGFRLLAEPFALPATVVGLVFLMYLSGTVTAAAAGRISDRLGRFRVLVASEGLMLLGLLLTLPAQLWLVLVGMLLFTGGFFAAHAVASGWVGALATSHRAEASSTYLFCYYAGSSVLGACAGAFWTRDGWGGVVGFVGTAVVLAALLAVLVRRRVRVRTG